MIETLLTYWELAVSQCLPDWRSGQPTVADIILAGLIASLFGLACIQCFAALRYGDDGDNERIKRSILGKSGNAD